MIPRMQISVSRFPTSGILSGFPACGFLGQSKAVQTSPVPNSMFKTRSQHVETDSVSRGWRDFSSARAHYHGPIRPNAYNPKSIVQGR